MFLVRGLPAVSVCGFSSRVLSAGAKRSRSPGNTGTRTLNSIEISRQQSRAKKAWGFVKGGEADVSTHVSDSDLSRTRGWEYPWRNTSRSQFNRRSYQYSIATTVTTLTMVAWLIGGGVSWRVATHGMTFKSVHLKCAAVAREMEAHSWKKAFGNPSESGGALCTSRDRDVDTSAIDEYGGRREHNAESDKTEAAEPPGWTRRSTKLILKKVRQGGAGEEDNAGFSEVNCANTPREERATYN
ncbi:hypothetical protein C8R45DRAFT_921921 [Mycena sanguinolenta]|nr:hypothetical protein C8R45DRAFT_921921 [Mycena sanguinolenta]